MGNVPIYTRRVIKLTRYQWTVFFAAWLGWGFDIFDGLLFNFVAPNAIPTLLGLADRRAEAQRRGALLDRHPQFTVPARLGRGRRDLRPHQRPLRPQARADDHHAAVRARHRRLRLRHRDVAARSPSASSRASASVANGRRAPRWSRKWCPRNRASKPARCCTRPRRSACSSPTFVNSEVAGELVRARSVDVLALRADVRPAARRPWHSSCACSSRSRRRWASGRRHRAAGTRARNLRARHARAHGQRADRRHRSR